MLKQTATAMLCAAAITGALAALPQAPSVQAAAVRSCAAVRWPGGVAKGIRAQGVSCLKARRMVRRCVVYGKPTLPGWKINLSFGSIRGETVLHRAAKRVLFHTRGRASDRNEGACNPL